MANSTKIVHTTSKKTLQTVTGSAPRFTVASVLPYILIIGGIIGFISAFIITQDKFMITANPNYRPSCDLNPIIACGNVMQSKQGSAFGFANSFIGLAAFAVLITVGVAMKAGATFKRWFWLGLEAGTILGLGFVHWLFFETVYRIHALCPYCIAVWIVVITTFWYVSLYNVDHTYIRLPHGRPTTAYNWVRRHHIDILLLWFLVITILVLKHFWYYYGKHL